MKDNALYDFFPLFTDVRDKCFLVIGAGKVGIRRVRTLLKFNCRIRIISDEISEEFAKLREESEYKKNEYRIEFIRKKISKNNISNKDIFSKDICNADFILACTNDSELNSYIVNRAKILGIPANNSSSKKDCDFYFPGIVTDEEIVIGIGASGRNHKKVHETVEKIRLMGAVNKIENKF